MEGEFITIAKVVKTQGRRGEVAVQMFSDFPERFQDRRRVFALDEKNQRRELQIEDFWSHKDLMILKFAGVDSISDAEALLKDEIQVPAAERTKLEEGWYVSDLVGCIVFDQGREIGKDASRRLGSAGRRAFSRGDLHAAENLLRRAIALVVEDDPLLLTMLPVFSEVLLQLGRFADARAFADQAFARAEKESNRRVMASAEIVRMLIRLQSGEPPG